ncbi:hypothetical protein ACR30L_07830 [Psychromonas sp. PT13]|uniref:hypothetical protein n=1 Tax=Psychromonas sp. PT13 TaxID=3439547 RepID=UPI003EBE53DC
MEFSDLQIIIISFTIVQTIVALWLKARITYSIRYEYDKKLENYKIEQLRKDKAAVIAEFLAEWTHLEGSNTKRLNQLLWELSLYLPSELVKDVQSMVSHGEGKTAPEVLVAVRDHLLDGKDKIAQEHISHFKHPDNQSMQNELS